MIQAVLSSKRPNKRLGLWVDEGEPIGPWSQASSRTRELAWVLGGKFALMGSNALLMLFLVHRLELPIYGVLVVTISGQLLISRILMLGVDVGMIRLSGLSELSQRRGEVVMGGLGVILLTSCALLIVSIAALPVLYSYRVPVWVYGSAVAGAIGTSLVDYGYGFRLAQQQYPLAAAAQGGTAIVRLGLTALAAILIPVNQAVFLAYHGASLISGLFQTAMMTNVRPVKSDRKLMRQLLRYSLWQGQANVIVIFSLYQGTFLLMLLGQQSATGIFGLSLTLSLGFFAIYNAYFEYLLARIWSVDNSNGLTGFMKHAFGTSLVLSIACIPIILGVVILVPRLLGPELWEIIPVFCYLGTSMALLILQSPLEVVCHYLLRPKLVSFAWALRAGLICVGGLLLAPGAGAEGAAVAQLVGSTLASIVLVVLVAGALRSRQPSPASQQPAGRVKRNQAVF